MADLDESRMKQLMKMDNRTDKDTKLDSAALNSLKKATEDNIIGNMAKPDRMLENLHCFKDTDNEAQATVTEGEVAQAEMESRLRRMITEVLRPSIAKVTKLQTDHEVMRGKFQDMIDGHAQVLAAQKQAKDVVEKVAVFQSKLDEFWTFNNALEDKMSEFQKAEVTRMEEFEHSLEANRNTGERLNRNLDRAMQDMDRLKQDMKAVQASFEYSTQKSKERLDTELRNCHRLIEDVRALHTKLEVEVWGPEDVSESSPPSLRKLNMQMKTQTQLLSEAMHDISATHMHITELFTATERQVTMEVQLKDLSDKSVSLAARVESCAQEAKADFQKASNLMAAFSANLVREARHSFKDELEHAHKLQKEVDAFVTQTQVSIKKTEGTMHSLSEQLKALVKEVRIDCENSDQKRKRDKQGFEEQLRQLQAKVTGACEASESIIRGLEHVSGVISMSLQSERMSVALDLQDFVERKDTAYVGVRGQDTKQRPGSKQRVGLDPESLHRIAYQPQHIQYQGTNFDRPQLLALREKLVHIAQEVLQKGPDLKPKSGGGGGGPISTPDLFTQYMRTGTPGRETRCSTPSGVGTGRPASRGQPGARGSPLLEGPPSNTYRDLRDPNAVAQLEAWSDTVRQASKASELATWSPNPEPRGGAAPTPTDDGVQLPALAAGVRDRLNARNSDVGRQSPPLSAR